ncbi:MAG: DUF5107 domain-containing protein, partial [Bacteroidales bacterium]|nr:DUF5107 domain-containing protein [Bacteroidales bacterium]
MENYPIIELVISLILVHFLFSLVISGIQELATGIIIKSRSSFLKRAIENILNDPQNKNWSELIYNHPLVSKLKRKASLNPSYISSETFSTCLIDIIINEGKQVEIKIEKTIKKEGAKKMRYLSLLTLVLVATGIFSSLSGQVRVYQEPLTLPTYRVMEPEIMPNWDVMRYPYPMLDRIKNEKYNRTYRALWVENEYVKALVLPEIGGRLHGAQDKTNGYQFLYDQTVIKPGLIGLTGAWISGGVEWNFPNGHRASGFRDTDWRLVENPDGSKTAWVGEIDRITGMRWSIGTTVHPGRNWVETKVRLFNCTPYVHRFQYWATSAVRATFNYQA